MKANLVYLFLKEYYQGRRLNQRFKSFTDVRNYQQDKILEHLEKIVPLAPFYQKRFEGHSFKEWYKLPVMNKQIMMDNFDELNTVGIKKSDAFKVALASEESRDFSSKVGNVTVGLSSGTSGNRGLFLISEEEQVRWAGNILAKVMPTSLFFGRKQTIAFFLRANSNLYSSVNNPKIAFHFFDLLGEIDDHIQRLNEYKPSILVAPASMLRLLAKAKQNGTLSINPIKIISVAEALNAEDKQELEKIFGQMIHQIYQCTEGFLAFTCSHGTLHVNDDLVFIEKEYIDGQNRKFVPIITDFSRTSQPIIRYRLNDILTEGTICTCGLPFMPIKQIDGRCDDVFYGQRKKITDDMKQREKIRILFADFIRRAVLLASDNSLEYKVKQLDLYTIEVQIDVQSGEREKLEEKIRIHLETFFEEMDCEIPAIHFKAYEQPVKGTKIRRVERCFNIEGVLE